MDGLVGLSSVNKKPETLGWVGEEGGLVQYAEDEDFSYPHSKRLGQKILCMGIYELPA